MLKLEVPRIVRTLAFKDYASELGEAVLHIWVNPPRDLLIQHDLLVAETKALRKRMAEGTEEKPLPDEEAAQIAARLVEIAGGVFAWYAEAWSQGPEGTQCTAEDVERFANETRATDPALFRWLTDRTMDLIDEHRRGAKKG